MHPELWTRIVIRLDLSKPIEALKKYIKRSKGHFIRSIYVYQPREDTTMPESVEAEVLADLVSLIAKEYTRCESLHVVAGYSSSIMSLLTILFQRNTRKLMTIKLESHRRSAQAALSPSATFPFIQGAVTTANLNSISLVGPHYVKLMRNRSWRVALKRCREVSISHLRLEDGFDSRPFLFSELWNSLREFHRLKSLRLHNVDIPDFDLGVEEADALPPHVSVGDWNWSLEYVTFSHVSSGVSAPLLGKIRQALKRTAIDRTMRSDLHILALDDCSFFNCRDIPTADVVKIRNIFNSDSLSLFLSGANAHRIEFIDCPGLDTSSIASLTIPVQYKSIAGTTKKKEYPVAHMTELLVHNCPNFTSLGLRELVKFRAKNSDGIFDPWSRLHALRIKRVRLGGSTPTPSPDELHWFKTNGVSVMNTPSLTDEGVWKEEIPKVVEEEEEDEGEDGEDDEDDESEEESEEE